MFSTDTSNELIQCPYDKTHQIMRKRFQMHILRCRKNHPNAELQTCPFNLTHLIPEEDYMHHMISCPDKKIISQYVREPTDIVVIKHAPISDDEEEKWEDADVPDFNLGSKLVKEPKSLKRRRYSQSQLPSRSRSRSPLAKRNNKRDGSKSSQRMRKTLSHSNSPTRSHPPLTSEIDRNRPNSSHQKYIHSKQDIETKYDLDNDPYYTRKNTI